MTYNHDLFYGSLQRFLIFSRESLESGYVIYSVKAYKIAILIFVYVSVIFIYYPLLFLKYIVFQRVLKK